MDYKLIIIIVLLLVAVVGYIRLYRHYRRNTKKVTFLFDAIDNGDFSFNFPTEKGFKEDKILHQSLNRTTLICDKDTVIAVSGGSKKELMERPIHEDVERCMKEREKLVINKGQCEMQGIIDGEDPEKYTAEVIVPILCAGDAIGAVVMVSREPGDMVGDTELKVCETAANFMGKQMEN